MPPRLTISKPVVINIRPRPPIMKEVGVQADMFLVASSPKQPLTLIAATIFSFTDDDET